MTTKKKLNKGVDHIGVTCVFFCFDKKGNLLMQKRSRKCRDEKGRWDCGSGSLEFGETFEEGARREIKEEYCVAPARLRLHGVTNVIRKNGKQKTHWVAVIFSAIITRPEKVRNGDPEKIDEVKWFDPKKLPRPLHSMLRKHLSTVRAMKKGVL